LHLYQFYELVLTKVRLNLKSEASKSYLSYSWWILEPALFVLAKHAIATVKRKGEAIEKIAINTWHGLLLKRLILLFATTK